MIGEPSDRLILLGGGHSHVEVLRRLRGRPTGLRCILVSENRFSLYSGMLPGYLAGHYRLDEIRIDMARLAQACGAEFLCRRAIAIDRQARRLMLEDGTELDYRLLSINTGAAPSLSTIPGAAEHAVAVKPLHQFIRRIDGLLSWSAESAAAPLTIVGGGAGGVEVALAVRHRCGLWPSTPEIRLVSGRRGLLPEHNSRVRALARKHLRQAGIANMEGQRVQQITRRNLILDDGSVLGAGLTLMVTAVRGPDWLRNTGLALDGNGFVRTHASLQSISDSAVFAAGDVASIEQQAITRAGVHAVRQGPVLSANLRRAERGTTLRPYRPQRVILGLIATGPRHAIVSRGAWATEGRWAWHWKNWLDRRFIARYRHGDN